MTHSSLELHNWIQHILARSNSRCRSPCAGPCRIEHDFISYSHVRAGQNCRTLLNDEFDIEVFDFRPWDKIDSPSGTALELARYAAEGSGVDLSYVTVTARHGEIGKRKCGSIGFSSTRGGDVPGENSVFF